MLTFSEHKIPARQRISFCHLTDDNLLPSLLPLPPHHPMKNFPYWSILQNFAGSKSYDVLASARKTQHKRENMIQHETRRDCKLIPQFSRDHRVYLATFRECQFNPKLLISLSLNQFHYALFLDSRNDIQFCNPCVWTKHILADSS